jgi:hypothetical protein
LEVDTSPEGETDEETVTLAARHVREKVGSAAIQA